jgi:hypothetical protein
MSGRNHLTSKRSFHPLLIGLAIVALFAIAFYLVQSGHLASGKPICSVCQRPLHKGMTFVVSTRDGKEYPACCPRCGLRFAIEKDAHPSKATDFSNGEIISPISAIYLEGSKVMECCTSTTVRSDNGMICEMHFDRCQPSLLTFARLEDAEAYQLRQGGRILSFAKVRESVLEQMGR